VTIFFPTASDTGVWQEGVAFQSSKNVELLLEVLNGDQKVMEARRTIRVEESDMVGREIGLPVPAASLKAEPTTQLRITVRTKDV